MGIFLVIEEAHTGISPQGVPPTQTQFFFRRLGAPDAVPRYKMLKKQLQIF